MGQGQTQVEVSDRGHGGELDSPPELLDGESCVVPSGEQAAQRHVRVGQGGIQLQRGLQLLYGGLRLTLLNERESEVQMGEREVRIELQRFGAGGKQRYHSGSDLYYAAAGWRTREQPSPRGCRRSGCTWMSARVD